MANKRSDFRSIIVAFGVFEDGKLSLNKTWEKFQAAATKYMVTTEAEQVLVLSHINKLFDLHPGARMSQKTIVGMVTRSIQDAEPRLNNIDSMSSLMDRVVEVLAEEIKAGRFATKQPHGTYRVADVPVNG